MLWYCLLIVMAALYYILLITNGNFDFMQSTYLGMTFNSMLEHLLRGEFNVAPDAVKVEGFTRNGKTYSYFGVAPALLQLPLLAGGSVSQYDLTRLYCALAATLGLCFKLASVALINGELPKSSTPGDRLFRARAVGAIRRRSNSIPQKLDLSGDDRMGWCPCRCLRVLLIAWFNQEQRVLYR